MQEKERGLPVVMHGRPGHLMLTSAFHDLADIARLELQPLRSTLHSSNPGGCPMHGDCGNSRGVLGSADSAWEGGGAQHQSGVGSSAAGKGRMDGEAAGEEQPSDQDGTVQGDREALPTEGLAGRTQRQTSAAAALAPEHVMAAAARPAA